MTNPPIKLPTRKGTTPFKVYCLPEEREIIEERAKQAGLSVSAYMLNTALGSPIKSMVDLQKVDDLLRINGDLGRLGGLLKLWLTNDERAAKFGEATILAVLAKISDSQLQLLRVAGTVIQPRVNR